MEVTIKHLTLILAQFVELAAALIIVFGAARALWTYFRRSILHPFDELPRSDIRLRLGTSLSLALEFALGADILKTAIAPNWEEIGKLAAIAALRTGLNYFLERDIRNASKELQYIKNQEGKGESPDVA